MDHFIHKAAWGLNAIFSSGDGFPRTCFLFCGGITDEQAYKRFLPTRQVQSAVWYSAASPRPHQCKYSSANNAGIRAGPVWSDERRRHESVAAPLRSGKPAVGIRGVRAPPLRHSTLRAVLPLQVDDIQGYPPGCTRMPAPSVLSAGRHHHSCCCQDVAEHARRSATPTSIHETPIGV